MINYPNFKSAMKDLLGLKVTPPFSISSLTRVMWLFTNNLLQSTYYLRRHCILTFRQFHWSLNIYSYAPWGFLFFLFGHDILKGFYSKKRTYVYYLLTTVLKHRLANEKSGNFWCTPKWIRIFVLQVVRKKCKNGYILEPQL